MKQYTVTVTKTLGKIWGIDNLIEDLGDVTKSERDATIIEILHEDIFEVVDKANWKITVREVK